MVTVVVLTVVMVFMLIVMSIMSVIVLVVLGKGDKLVVDVSKLLGSIMAALGTDSTLGMGIV